jgi:hypothetical protein
MANFNLPTVPTTPEGGLAGFYRGTQYNYGLADLERQFRDADLTNQRMQNLYQNELLDNPMKEAERGSKIATAGYEQDLINSGAKRDMFDTELSGKKSSNQGQELLNQKNEIILASDALSRAAAMPDMALIGQWDELGKQAKTLKIKWPEGGPVPENMVKLRQMAEASRMTVERLNKIQDEQIKFGHRMAEQSLQDDNAFKRTKYQADSSAAATRYSADAQASIVKQQAIDRDVYAQAKNEMASNGGVLSYSTALQVGETQLKGEGITFEKLLTKAETQVTKEQQGRDKYLSPAEQASRATTIARETWNALAIQRGLNATGGKLPAKELAKLPAEVGTILKNNGQVATGPGASEGAAPLNTGANQSGAKTQQQVVAGVIPEASPEELKLVENAMKLPQYSGIPVRQLYEKIKAAVAAEQAVKDKGLGFIPTPTTDLSPDPTRSNLPNLLQGMGPQTPSQMFQR